MKKLLAAFFGLAFIHAAYAQPIGEIPVSRGPGVTGFAGTYTPSVSGGVARTVKSKLGERVSIKDYCPTAGGGVTDDAICIRNVALVNAPEGTRLYFPAGRYLLDSCRTSNGGKAAIDMADTAIRDKLLSFEGDGFSFHASNGYTSTAPLGGTVFLLGSNIPSDCDFMRFAATKPLQGRQIRGFVVRPFVDAAAFYGQHGINFDGVSDAYYEFSVLIENLFVLNGASTGCAVRSSGSASNVGGVLNASTIRNNHFMSCISLTLVGDSIRILNNNIGGSSVAGTIGIAVTQFSGGGALLVVGNNLNNTAGSMTLGASAGAMIVNNYMETNSNTAAARLTLTGATWPMVAGNLFTNNGSTAATGVSIAGATTGAHFHNNAVSVPTGSTAITIGASATNNNIGLNSLYVNGAWTPSSITDSGTGTTYAPQSANTSFLLGSILIGDANGKIGQDNTNLAFVSNNLKIGNPTNGLGILLHNNTSGSLRVIATAGVALGTSVISLPSGTDTLVGKATTDTLTNKTFDTAGTGNSFSINGVAATANTGTGAVARQTSPNFLTGISANGSAGLSATTTVRAGGGASDCTLIFTFGLKTGGSC